MPAALVPAKSGVMTRRRSKEEAAIKLGEGGQRALSSMPRGGGAEEIASVAAAKVRGDGQRQPSGIGTAAIGDASVPKRKASLKTAAAATPDTHKKKRKQNRHEQHGEEQRGLEQQRGGIGGGIGGWNGDGDEGDRSPSYTRLRAEIEEGSMWTLHNDAKASSDEWIRSCDRRLAANSRRKHKFIPLSDDVDALLAAKDDGAAAIMMMHKRELMYPICCGLHRHNELNGFCRSVVVAWMVEVNRDYNFSDVTLHAAVRILDAFLFRIDKSICRSQLQLVGVTAVLIASKFHEPAQNLTPKECSWVTDKTYTYDEVILMERLMLSTLRYQVAFPLSLGFLDVYSNALGAEAGGGGGSGSASGSGDDDIGGKGGDDNVGANNNLDNRSSSRLASVGTAAAFANRPATTLAPATEVPSANACALECNENVDGAGVGVANWPDENLNGEGLGGLGRVVDESTMLANYVIDNALLYADSLRFPPSLQAATALALARCLQSRLSAPHHQHTQPYTGISLPSASVVRTSSASASSSSSSPTWKFVMDDDIAEMSGYTTELALDCAKFLLLSLASSKGFGGAGQSGRSSNTHSHLEAVQKKYAQRNNGGDSDMLRTRRGSYSYWRAGDSMEDIATVAQMILVARGWCDVFGSAPPPSASAAAAAAGAGAPAPAA